MKQELFERKSFGRISVRRSVLISIGVFAVLGLSYTSCTGIRFIQFITAPKASYRTHFGSQTIAQSPITDELIDKRLIGRFESDFVQMFFDTVRILMGENIPLPTDYRIVLQLRINPHNQDRRVAIYFDYWYPCHVCDSFPLYRVNVIHDSLSGRLLFNSIFYAGLISASEYATYKEMEGR